MHQQTKGDVVWSFSIPFCLISLERVPLNLDKLNLFHVVWKSGHSGNPPVCTLSLAVTGHVWPWPDFCVSWPRSSHLGSKYSYSLSHLSSAHEPISPSEASVVVAGLRFPGQSLVTINTQSYFQSLTQHLWDPGWSKAFSEAQMEGQREHSFCLYLARTSLELGLGPSLKDLRLQFWRILFFPPEGLWLSDPNSCI